MTISNRTPMPEITRRKLLASAASAAVIAVVATPAMPVIAGTKAKTEPEMPDFKNNWNASVYIDHMLAGGLACDSFYRGERLVSYQYWAPELVGPNENMKNREFLAELKRRGRAHQVPDGRGPNDFIDEFYGRGRFARA